MDRVGQPMRAAKASDLFDGAVSRMKGNADERFTMNSYAKGLAAMLQDSSLPVPLLMGVHGKYGSGKTRLIKNVLWKIGRVCGFSCNNLGRPVQSADVRWMYELCGGCRLSFFAYLLLLVLLFAAAVGGVMSYMTWAGLTYHESMHRNSSGGGSSITSSSREAGEAESTTAAAAPPESAAARGGGANLTTPALPVATDGGARDGNGAWAVSDDVLYPLVAASAFMGAGLLLVLVAVIAYYCHYCRRRPAAVAAAAAPECARSYDGWWQQLRLMLVMLLCETPPAPVVRKHDKVEVIPVVFDAWEYAGCDVLWAGIVKNIFDEIEAVFGKWKLRVYRTFRQTDLSHQHDSSVIDGVPGATAAAAPGGKDIESYFGDSMTSRNGDATTTVDVSFSVDATDMESQHSAAAASGARRPQPRQAPAVTVHTAKWLHVPYPVVALLAASTVAVSALVLLLLAFASRDRSLHTIEQYIRLAASVLLGLTVVSQLSNGWSLLRSAFSSQSSQLVTAMSKMKGPDLSADLGFMHTVKTEVQRVNGFVKLMERLYRKKFRILIVIDDLDRCPADRVRSILEAVSILLSDEDSLFVTLIAIDHNAIARAIGDGGGGGGGEEAGDSSDYLRRLIQMRFCIPEWTASDMETALDRSLCRRDERRLGTRRCAGGGDRRSRRCLPGGEAFRYAAAIQAEIPRLLSGLRDAEAEARIKSKLRRRMTKLATQELRRRIDVLPTSFRDVRHLCNMVFFTVYLWVDKIHVGGGETLESLQLALADVCAELTRWVILTEEWPYRCSWILKHIDDMDELARRLSRGQLNGVADHEQALLSEVYAHIRERVKEPKDWKRRIVNDGSADHFEAALEAWPISVHAVRHFLPFTINLDRAIKHQILEHCKTLEDEQCRMCKQASTSLLGAALGSRDTLSGQSGDGGGGGAYSLNEFDV